jgi:hypothetical protein
MSSSFTSVGGVFVFLSALLFCLPGCGEPPFPEKFKVTLDARYPRVDQTLDLPIVNFYDEPAIVSGFRTSCNCSTLQFDPIEIAAGERASLPIQLDSTLMAAAFPESRFPDGGSVELTPILTSRQDGTKSSPGVPIQVSFQFQSSMRLDQTTLYFGLGQHKQRLQITCQPDVAEVRLGRLPDDVRVESVSGEVFGRGQESGSLQEAVSLVPIDGVVDLVFKVDSPTRNQAESVGSTTISAFDSGGSSIGQVTIAFNIAQSDLFQLSRDHFVVDGQQAVIRTMIMPAVDGAVIKDARVEGQSAITVSDVRIDSSDRSLEMTVQAMTVPSFEALKVVVTDSRGQETTIPLDVTFR